MTFALRFLEYDFI